MEVRALDHIYKFQCMQLMLRSSDGYTYDDVSMPNMNPVVHVDLEKINLDVPTLCVRKVSCDANV